MRSRCGNRPSLILRPGAAGDGTLTIVRPVIQRAVGLRSMDVITVRLANGVGWGSMSHPPSSVGVPHDPDPFVGVQINPAAFGIRS